MKIGLIFFTATLCASILSFASRASAPRITAARAIVAKKFEFSPASITVKKGEPVELDLKSVDVVHGFSIPDFHVRATLKPGETIRVSFTPNKAGSFPFACDMFCGAGHEDMAGTLVVTE